MLLIAISLVRYETADGTSVQESGIQKQIGDNPLHIGIVSKGTYSYVTMDGLFRIIVNWIANEKGFQPTIYQVPIQDNLHG